MNSANNSLDPIVLQKRIAELEAALERYGVHDLNCRWFEHHDCDCGWHKTKAALEGKKE